MNLKVYLFVVDTSKRWDDNLDAGLLKDCPECIIERQLLPSLSRLYPPRGPRGGPLAVNCKIVIKELMEMSVKAETLQVMAWARFIWLVVNLLISASIFYMFFFIQTDFANLKFNLTSNDL